MTIAITPPTLTALASPPVSAATDKMRQEGLPEIAIDTFAHYEDRLRSGEQGLLPEAELEPLTDVPSAEELPSPTPPPSSRSSCSSSTAGSGRAWG